MTQAMFAFADIRAFAPGPVRGVVALAAVIVVGWLLIAWLEARTVRVDRRTVHDPRIPAALDGTTLVFAADIHAGPIFGETRVRHLVDTINAEEPSFVVLGGDYVGGNANGAAIFYPHIAGLDAPLGVFAVLGNHDSWEGADEARDGLASAGVRLLENSTARVGEGDRSIVIGGLEDEWTGHPAGADFAEALSPDDFGILVAHNPDSFEPVLSRPQGTWGLALSGHTHGGQVTGFYWLLPRKPSRFGTRFLGGWRMENGTPLLVSNGVGAVTVPLRFLAPPQIHVITLRRDEPAG